MLTGNFEEKKLRKLCSPDEDREDQDGQLTGRERQPPQGSPQTNLVTQISHCRHHQLLPSATTLLTLSNPVLMSVST